MCGLVGIINKSKKVSCSKLKFINNLQKHRGPDEDGYYVQQNIGLAMRRLSIIDLKQGSQPKISEDKKIIVFLNGEIFNYQELSKVYLKKDIKSDTDVILNLYLKFGLKFLSKINGMFSIVIYDKNKKFFYLIRDRFGIKPLYYYYDKASLIYSSEIFPIKKIIKNCEIDNQSVSNFLTLGYIFNKEKTIYQNIFKILPGQIIELNLKKFKLTKKFWWNFKPKNKEKINKKNYLKYAENQLLKTVKSWTKSDVPISFMLSGGIDSALLAAMYSSINKKKINTYSMIFSKENKILDESETINNFLSKYPSNHTNIKFNADEIKRDIFNIINSLEEPYGGGIPSWFVLKKIKKKFKVTITGTGGDELFGNYNRFFKISNKTNDYYKKENFYNYYFNNLYKLDHNFKKNYTKLNLQKLKKTEDFFFNILNKRRKYFNSSKNYSYLDFSTQLDNEFLFFSDRFSMRHSVELRTPFLDHNLFNLIFNYPEDLRISNKEYKPILRKLAMKYLPKKYLQQKKKGFSFPVSYLMRGKMKAITKNYLSKKKLNQSGYFKENFINDILMPFFKGDNTNLTKIWNILMFQIWYEKEINHI